MTMKATRRRAVATARGTFERYQIGERNSEGKRLTGASALLRQLTVVVANPPSTLAREIGSRDKKL
jgi:hypothetical protein